MFAFVDWFYQKLALEPPAWLLQQWRFQAVLDSAVKKFDRTKIIFQWLRGGGGWQEPGVYKICFVVNCRKLVNDKSSAHLTQAAGVLKLKIINNVNIYPAICHSWKVYTECFYIFCRCWMSLRPRPNTVTPKLCPGSRVRHLAPQTFHLARVWSPAQDTPCNVMPSSVLWLLFHFVYFNHELWTDSCSQKWLECHKTDMGHFYL